MMLATCACLPPSWLAMLPQKFSAATTLMTRLLPLISPPVLHPAAVTITSRQPAQSSRPGVRRLLPIMIASRGRYENRFHYNLAHREVEVNYRSEARALLLTVDNL